MQLHWGKKYVNDDINNFVLKIENTTFISIIFIMTSNNSNYFVNGKILNLYLHFFYFKSNFFRLYKLLKM